MNKEELKRFFNGKKILVTGHTGFKGSWLIQMLLNFDASITGYSLEPNTKPNLFNILKLKEQTNNYFADICDYQKLLNVIKEEKPEIIFHLAAQPLVRDSYDDPIYTFETNVIGTVNLLNAIKEINTVKCAVIITTDKVYEDKGNIFYKETDELGCYDPYSTSKVCAEFVVKSYIRSFFNPKDYGNIHKTLIASARSGNVIGGGDWSKDRLLPDIIKSLFEKKESIIIRNPDSIRPWQYVLEPLLGYLILSIKLYQGNKDFVGPWNFAPNEENFITVKELVEKVISITKKGKYIVKKENKKHETNILRLDATKAKQRLKWKPLLKMDETLRWTLEWYRRYYGNEEVIKFTNKQINDFLERQ